MRRRSSSDAALAGAPTASHYRARPERAACGRERIGLTFGHLLIRVSGARPYVARQTRDVAAELEAASRSPIVCSLLQAWNQRTLIAPGSPAVSSPMRAASIP